MTKLKKEVCGRCLGNIKLSESINECHECDCVIHTRCYNSAKFANINGKYYCKTCKLNVEIRYNPFKFDIVNPCENDEDSEIAANIQKMSDILENCNSYSINDLNSIEPTLFKNNFSTYFLNLDGNKSNFDRFVVELNQYTHKFPVIGIAETNIDPALKDAYQMAEYNSFYQDIQPGKGKGTGVGLYIHNSLNATVIDKFSHSTPNLETLFVSISNHPQPITVGVLYRPPNGSSDAALNELSSIIESLPKKSVYIMGDFNIDLHTPNSKLVNELEEIALTTGFIPLISLNTHHQ